MMIDALIGFILVHFVDQNLVRNVERQGRSHVLTIRSQGGAS
jgi:hypothetical protein